MAKTSTETSFSAYPSAPGGMIAIEPVTTLVKIDALVLL